MDSGTVDSVPPSTQGTVPTADPITTEGLQDILKEINVDVAQSLSKEQKQQLRNIFKKNLKVFQNDLPG